MIPNIKRILVPTDFSATSDAALEYARVVGERFGASLHLLHVVGEPYLAGGLVSESYMAEGPGVRTAMLQDARERLLHRITPRDKAVLSATTEVIIGDTANTIVDYAVDESFDVIVMGTHGRTGLAHVLMGSVAEKVVRTAPCPVLTVRQAACAVEDQLLVPMGVIVNC